MEGTAYFYVSQKKVRINKGVAYFLKKMHINLKNVQLIFMFFNKYVQIKES